MGENFAGYVDSGVLTANRSDFTADMFKFYVSTPMIIIDGQKGPLNIGSLPLVSSAQAGAGFIELQ